MQNEIKLHHTKAFSPEFLLKILRQRTLKDDDDDEEEEVRRKMKERTGVRSDERMRKGTAEDGNNLIKAQENDRKKWRKDAKRKETTWKRVGREFEVRGR